MYRVHFMPMTPFKFLKNILKTSNLPLPCKTVVDKERKFSLGNHNFNKKNPWEDQILDKHIRPNHKTSRT